MFDAILPQFGIECRFVDINKPESIAAAVDSKTRCVFAETVSNPALQVTDLEAVSEVAKAHGLPFVVDDTFTTPYLCKPFNHGADIIAHSLTKWSGGHGVGIGGILCDRCVYSTSCLVHLNCEQASNLTFILCPLAAVVLSGETATIRFTTSPTIPTVVCVGATTFPQR